MRAIALLTARTVDPAFTSPLAAVCVHCEHYANVVCQTRAEAEPCTTAAAATAAAAAAGRDSSAAAAHAGEAVDADFGGGASSKRFGYVVVID